MLYEVITLVTYLQITMAILPVFVLITTVRSVAGDRVESDGCMGRHDPASGHRHVCPVPFSGTP